MIHGIVCHWNRIEILNKFHWNRFYHQTIFKNHNCVHVVTKLLFYSQCLWKRLFNLYRGIAERSVGIWNEQLKCWKCFASVVLDLEGKMTLIDQSAFNGINFKNSFSFFSTFWFLFSISQFLFSTIQSYWLNFSTFQYPQFEISDINWFMNISKIIQSKRFYSSESEGSRSKVCHQFIDVPNPIC